MHNTLTRHRNVDAETLNELLSTDWMVDMKPNGYYERKMWMSGGCAGKRDDPSDSHIGLRAVPGTASGKDRWCDNRPAANPTVAELADLMEEDDIDIYVPIQWVLKAVESDDMGEFLSR